MTLNLSKFWGLPHNLPKLNKPKMFISFNTVSLESIFSKAFSFSSFSVSCITLRNSLLKWVASVFPCLNLKNNWSVLRGIGAWQLYFFDNSLPKARRIDHGQPRGKARWTAVPGPTTVRGLNIYEFIYFEI